MLSLKYSIKFAYSYTDKMAVTIQNFCNIMLIKKLLFKTILQDSWVIQKMFSMQHEPNRLEKHHIPKKLSD